MTFFRSKTMIEISKEIIYQELIKRIDKIFALPEVCAVKIKDINIEKSQPKEKIYILLKQAVEISYHDALSDIDMSVMVKLSSENTVTPQQYMKMINRYGITRDCYLGLVLIPDNMMYRIIMRNGMRYDLGFVQIQALAKLYRNDFLISDHLANINTNETLVQQMVLRDIKYGTNFHRYGYKEELEYLQVNEAECPYKRDNAVFNKIAAKIYAASITYDKLTLHFYPEYKDRREILFDIWRCYDKTLYV